MDTNAILGNMSRTAVNERVLGGPIQDLIARRERAALRTARALSAARPRITLRPASRGRAATSPARRAARSVWIPLRRETVGEKVLMGLLVLAAVGAIAYGFLSLWDYVQNWTLINAWVARLLSA
jgi:hypothetical protein